MIWIHVVWCKQDDWLVVSGNVLFSSRSSFFVFVARDRHYGDVCHVFECVDQWARSLVETLHDVMVTSCAEAGGGGTSPPEKEKKTAIAKGDNNATGKVVDDLNNNSVVIGTCMLVEQLAVAFCLKINQLIEFINR